MVNFTELFTATLNETLAKMVAEAVAAQTEQMLAMQDRIESLEAALEEVSKKEDIESEIERAIENYDFSDIVQNNLDADELYGSREFSSAVKEVISEAMR